MPLLRQHSNKLVVLAAGGTLPLLSWIERQDFVMKWRLERNLRNTPFAETSNAHFSILTHVLERGEIPFSRPDLQRSLLCALKDCHLGRQTLIVGGAWGLGKSVFW